MNKQSLLRQLPIALVVVTAGIGIAQSATTGRVFPYVGYLEENGFPVDGERDMRINLYTAASGGNACQTVPFDAVAVANGRFKVDIEDVSDACLLEGVLYAALSVGPLGGQLTDLTTGEGAGRVMIGAVPFAAAGPKAATFFTEIDADIGRHLVVGSNATVGAALGVGTNVTAGGNIAASGDVSVGDDLFVQQGARFSCTGCGANGTFDGTLNWGNLTIQGRVLSADSNIHLSPPSGLNVIIDDTFRAAGGASGGTPVGLSVQGNLSLGGRHLPDYDTGWVNAATNVANTHNHSLGVRPFQFTILVATEANGGGDVSLGNGMWNYGTEAESRGVIVTGITTTSFMVRTGVDYLVDTWGMGGTRVLDNNGSYRVLVWR